MNRKTGVVMSYILMVFEVLSTLLLTPYIIRTLGQAEFGVYKLAGSINAYLLLLDLGMGNAIIRYVSKYRATGDMVSQKKFLGVATLYYLGIAAVTVIIGLILIAIFPSAFSKGLTESEIQLGQKLLSITMLNSAVTLGTAVYNNVLVAYERYTVSKGYSIVQIIFRIILTYLALKAGMGSIGIVSVNLLMTVLCRSFFIGYVLKVLKLRPQFRSLNLGFVKDIVAYSSLILLQMVATQINDTADQILLGLLVPSSATIIAVYGVGSQIVTYFRSIGTAFTGVLMPGVVRLVESGSSSQQICDEMVRIGRIILIVLGAIWGCFLLYGQQFVIFWAGKENSDAYYVSMLLITAQLPIITQTVGTQVLWAKNVHKEAASVKIVIVLLNLGLTIMLIRWNPLIGATIGTFIALVLGDVIARNIVFQKKIGISLRQYYFGLLDGLLPSLIGLLASGLLTKYILIDGWGGFVFKVVFSCTVYALCLWLFGLNRYEKKLALSFIKKNNIHGGGRYE